MRVPLSETGSTYLSKYVMPLVPWAMAGWGFANSTVDEIVPKLKAIAKSGAEERIFVRGDRKVDYGTVMRVMGRLSAAGYRRVALVTEVEQGN